MHPLKMHQQYPINSFSAAKFHSEDLKNKLETKPDFSFFFSCLLIEKWFLAKYFKSRYYTEQDVVWYYTEQDVPWYYTEQDLP